MIPLVDLKAQHQALMAELTAVLKDVLVGAEFIRGDACRRFEDEFASFCGVRAACGVASGTDALYLALEALGIGAGDEVITTPFSFVATAEAISRNGADVVFADVEEDTLNLDPAQVERSITPRTKAILPVHLYGHPAEMDELLDLGHRHGLIVLEDAAQAHGAEYRGVRAGALGRAGCFSFYPTKNLGACGDAGMLVSNDAELIERVRQIANHGDIGKYEHAVEGVSSRLDNLQAAILRVKLKHLEKWNERRRGIAHRYRQALKGLSGLKLPEEMPWCRAIYHQFTVRSWHRDGLRAHLESEGVGTAIHYPRPIHLQRAYSHLGLVEGSLPIAENAAREVLSLPMHPELTDETVDDIALAVREYFEDLRV